MTHCNRNHCDVTCDSGNIFCGREPAYRCLMPSNCDITVWKSLNRMTWYCTPKVNVRFCKPSVETVRQTKDILSKTRFACHCGLQVVTLYRPYHINFKKLEALLCNDENEIMTL